MVGGQFQSLTGSIHTMEQIGKLTRGGIGFNPSQVQFTLVILQVERLYEYEFQSLTGSIHTFDSLKNATASLFVSIPHRFNSHTYHF